MKSLEYVKQRIASGETELTDVVWHDLSEINFKDAFKQIYKKDFPQNNKMETRTNNGVRRLVAEFIYDPDADYNYFSTERCIHDGTFLFVGQTVEKLLQKMIQCETFNIEVMKDIETPVKEEFFIHHHFRYTFGNIVLGNEFDGDFVPENKKWMTERTTAMLPIKFEIIQDDLIIDENFIKINDGDSSKDITVAELRDFLNSLDSTYDNCTIEVNGEYGLINEYIIHENVIIFHGTP